MKETTETHLRRRRGCLDRGDVGEAGEERDEDGLRGRTAESARWAGHALVGRWAN